MKVLISWSGALSKAVAEIFKDWLKCVLQATEPWISTEDIAKGSNWFAEISDQLNVTSVGILCLTRENVNSRWILYEAGGLAKGLNESRVCTFLIDLKPTDVEPPLGSFNATSPVKEDVFKLVCSINADLGEKRVPDELMRRIFEKFWPSFESDFRDALARFKPAKEIHSRPLPELVEEVLEISRQNQSQLRSALVKLTLLETQFAYPIQMYPSQVGAPTVLAKPGQHFPVQAQPGMTDQETAAARLREEQEILRRLQEFTGPKAPSDLSR